MSIIDLTGFIPTAGQRVIQDVINATWTLASNKSSSTSAKFTNATNDFLSVANTPEIGTSEIPPQFITPPSVDIPQTLEVEDVLSRFSAEYRELMEILEVKFAEFIENRFPNEAESYAKLESWLMSAMENGGIDEATEDRIYDSQRSRILEDASRASDAVLATFASRRYPVPPGAALGAVRAVQQKAQSDVAEAGGKLAAMRLDMQKFTVEKLSGLRQVALSSASDYIKALVSAPEVSSKLLNVGYDAQTKLISAAADFYRADISAAELNSKIGQFNVTTALEAASKNQAANLAMVDAKLKALLAEAQAVAQETAALFNNLNVSTSMSANESLELSP